MLLPLGTQYSSLLLTLCHGNACLTAPLSFGHRSPALPLRGHLAVHSCLDLLGRHDLPYLHSGDLHAPALGRLVHLRAQHRVDLLPLGQHVIQQDVADHCSQGRGGQPLGGAGVVLHVKHAQRWLHHLGIDQKVYIDGRIVLGDARLVGDTDELLPEVNRRRPLNGGQEQDEPGTSIPHVPPQPEHHQPLVLLDDLDRAPEKHSGQDDEQAHNDEAHRCPPFL